MNIQTLLLIIVSGLIIVDAYITWATYKQTEKDCNDMKYDIEAIKTKLELVCTDVEYHKEHINKLIDSLGLLQSEVYMLDKEIPQVKPSKGSGCSKKEVK